MTHSGVALIDPHKVFEKVALASGMRVADLGCGRTGHFVFSAARVVGEKGIVYAVDVMKDILENLKSRVRSEGYDNVQMVWSDIESPGKTPIPSATIDACFIVNVMYLVANRAGVMKEAARMLKDGGFLAVVDWAKKIGPLGPPPEKMVSADALKAAAEKAGLTTIDNFALGDYHYCVIFKKMGRAL